MVISVRFRRRLFTICLTLTNLLTRHRLQQRLATRHLHDGLMQILGRGVLQHKTCVPACTASSSTALSSNVIRRMTGLVAPAVLVWH
jgi:hypothetical protein